MSSNLKSMSMYEFARVHLTTCIVVSTITSLVVLVDGLHTGEMKKY